MNAYRRREIAKISTLVEELKERVDSLYSDEEEAYGNMPDSLKDGDRGQLMQEALENLQYASDDLQECLDHLEEASA